MSIALAEPYSSSVRIQKKTKWTDEEDEKIIEGKKLNRTDKQIAEGIVGKDANNVYSRWKNRKNWLDSADFESFKKNNKKQKTE